MNPSRTPLFSPVHPSPKAGLLSVALWAACSLGAYITPEDYPFAPAAGLPGSTAIEAGDEAITAWATGVASVEFGSNVDEAFRDPFQALGPAESNSMGVVSLGRGGRIVLTFDRPLADGQGADFAVFENAFSDDFLELAWVEVSSDGETFVRFPHYSATAAPVGAFGTMDPVRVHGFAGKYRQGYGTPFDLRHLVEAHADAAAGRDPFSEAYRRHLLDTFPFLDVEAVRYVRIVDVVGDGGARSAIPGDGGQGLPVYDPFPTSGSAGFDLDAVAVLNQRSSTLAFSEFASGIGLPGDPSIDSDTDGDPDGLEYLLGSDPLDPFSKFHYKLQPVGEGLEVLFLRDPDAEGDLVLQASGNLVSWEVVSGNVGPTGSVDQQGLQRMRMTVPSVSGLLFWRLEAVIPQ